MTPKSRSCLLPLAAVLAVPAVAFAQAAAPGASFSVAPEDPRAGDSVQFVSSSCQPNGRLVGQRWDLVGDGEYADAQGTQAQMTFPAAGRFSVGLQETWRRCAYCVRRRAEQVETD